MPKSSANKPKKKPVKRPKKIIELKSVTLAPELPNRRSPYQPAFAEQARAMCQLGATDFDLADFFEVSWRSIKRWESIHPEFNAALKRGKEAADDRVERSLYARATGYTFESVKLFNNEGEIIKEPIIEHVPPDVTACIFWLKNRRSAEWRDKTDHDVNHMHSLHLQGGTMSVADAQAMFRNARNLTPAELERTLKTIEGTTNK